MTNLVGKIHDRQRISFSWK